MIFNLSDVPSIAGKFIAELRDVQIQRDSMRFRKNLERIGEILAYEISKKLPYQQKEVETPLGISSCQLLDKPVVLATILRAGLPMHQGMLNYFDQAGNAFVSAYRRHHKDGTFDIHLEYISCPNLNDCILIVCDPMLATGASMSLVTRELLNYGTPASIHFVTVIASVPGVDHMRRMFPDAYIWMGALDEELTAKSYIVPGLGDAGDLSYGAKLQE
ncbi:MAG TPA: uracil phosphoribosyltransferase [Saprospiraceae bacterium]|nr:uracil phosphoribosyltransferase [Saprospiraceae bacterium]HMQ81917.1 uracil phosphoribosyltransferase [Saprospiraceae bacterium]